MSRGQWFALGSTLTLMSCNDGSTPSPASQTGDATTPDVTSVDAPVDLSVVPDSTTLPDVSEDSPSPSDGGARDTFAETEAGWADSSDVTTDAGTWDASDDTADGGGADASDATTDGGGADASDATTDGGAVDASDATTDAGAVDVVVGDAPPPDAPADRLVDADAATNRFFCTVPNACGNNDAYVCPTCERGQQYCLPTTCIGYDAGAYTYPTQCAPYPTCRCLQEAGWYPSCPCLDDGAGGVVFICNACYGSPPARWERLRDVYIAGVALVLSRLVGRGT